ANPFTDAEGRPAYWRDVGTLEAYWHAHMELLVPEPPFDLYDRAWPITTLAEALPPARLLFDSARQGSVANSLLAGGVVIRGAAVTNSVLAGNVQGETSPTRDEAVGLPNAPSGPGCQHRRVVAAEAVSRPAA